MTNPLFPSMHTHDIDAEIDKWKSLHWQRTAELRECFAETKRQSDLAWEDREKWRKRANNNYKKYSTEAKGLRIENERLTSIFMRLQLLMRERNVDVEIVNIVNEALKEPDDV